MFEPEEFVLGPDHLPESLLDEADGRLLHGQAIIAFSEKLPQKIRDHRM